MSFVYAVVEFLSKNRVLDLVCLYGNFPINFVN